MRANIICRRRLARGIAPHNLARAMRFLRGRPFYDATLGVVDASERERARARASANTERRWSLLNARDAHHLGSVVCFRAKA